MIQTSWWRRILLFLIGTLIVALTQSYGISSQVQQSECRSIQHSLGTTCIPDHPQRIVVLDQESLEILVALGLKPIASTIPNRVGNKIPLLQARLDAIAPQASEEIVFLGRDGQPNLEKVVQLHPDLIVGFFFSSQMYSLLSQIAPTISIEYSQTDWKKTLQQVGEMVDRRSEAENLLKNYDQRIAKIKSRFTSNLKVSIMRFYTDLQFTQFLNHNSFAVSVLDDLQVVSIPPIQRSLTQIPNSDYGYINVSLEQIDLLEADAMFVALDPGAEKNFQIYANSPFWQTLNVVKQKKVYIMDSSYWIFGNVLSAHAVLDDLLKYLAPTIPLS